MFGQNDQSHFNSLWERKLTDSSLSREYSPGANLRVDEALKVLARGRRLLDIGCGTGILLAESKDRYQEVYGVDIAASAVALARQKDIKADVVNLNVDGLPYPDGFFDAVTILSAIQYFYNMDRVLQDCARVLSPLGVLLLSVPNMRAIWRIGKLLFLGKFPGVSHDPENYDGGTLHYFTTSDINGLLIRNGFQVVSAYGIFCIPKFLTPFPNRGMFGRAKREFFSAEIFVQAIKVSQEHIQK